MIDKKKLEKKKYVWYIAYTGGVSYCFNQTERDYFVSFLSQESIQNNKQEEGKNFVLRWQWKMQVLLFEDLKGEKDTKAYNNNYKGRIMIY